MRLGPALSVCSPSGRPFSPASIANLLLDANPTSANVTLATTKVSSLVDASGNGNTLAQGTDANRPTYTAANAWFRGHPSMDFSAAAATYLAATSTPAIATALSGSDVPLTVVAVVRRTTKLTTTEQMLWSLGNSGSANGYIAGSWHDATNDRQYVRMRIRESAGVVSETAPRENSRNLTDHDPQIIIFSLSGTTASGYIVGHSQNPLYDAAADFVEVSADYSAHGAITFDQFAIGTFLRSSATLPGEFELARLVVYGHELTDGERMRLAAYLWAKYIANPAGDLPLSLANAVHDWDASAIPDNIGTTCAQLDDGSGGKHFVQATEAARPLVIDAGNGRKALRFDGSDDVMAAGVAGDWPLLHDGSDLTLAVVYRVLDSANALTPILDTLDNDPTNNSGLGVYHDAASAAHSLQVKVGATNATPVLNHDSQDYGATPGEWHVAILTHEAAVPTLDQNFRLTLDNETYAEADDGVTPDVADPTYALTLGALAGGVTFGAVDIGEIWIYDRKLGKVGEVQWLGEYLAAKWNSQHVALAGGNGYAGLLDDATPHRAFPAIVEDAAGRYHVFYRRGADHGGSRGAGIQVTSANLLRWSAERVIYDIDDDDGRDFRCECGAIRLRLGSHAGRLLLSSKWSDDTSNIEVTGVPSTLLIGTSDDNGGSWSWADPLDGKTAFLATIDYTASPNGLVELQHGDNAGRVLFTFTDSETGEGTGDQDVLITYSDDGGASWSDPVVILDHDAIAWRATETHIVEFGDGYLLLTVRDDTNHVIYTMDSTDGGATWGNLTSAFAGWGRPVTILDENERLYCFFRSASSNKAVWNASDDRGATWSAERALSNLQTTTGVDAYPTMSYCYPLVDAAGDVVLAVGLEDSAAGDADVFVRAWRRRQPTKAVALANASNQYLTAPHSAVWDVSAAAGFTACGWVYLDSTGAQYIAGKYAAAGTREWALYLSASDYLVARLCGDGTTPTTFTSTLTLSDAGTWYFVALRYDPTDPVGELIVNVDAGTKQQTSHSGGLFSGAAAVRLGTSDISLTDSLDGRLDRWGFWSRALSDAELEAIRNSGEGVEYRDLSDVQKIGLIAFYNLGQYSGNRADSSGNGQHLAPVNDPGNAAGVAG